MAAITAIRDPPQTDDVAGQEQTKLAGGISRSRARVSRIVYPREFTGRRLELIAMPLGSVCTGSVSLGGRGQLRDWEIFNKPDKGRSLTYAFPSIWIRDGKRSIARVLEARFQPPYQGQNGLGARNAPGLSRIAAARFTGEYPFGRVQFQDRSLPLTVALEAFSPFVPHNEDESGLPVAVLRYSITNNTSRAIEASIAFSIENPVIAEEKPPGDKSPDTRSNAFREEKDFSGLHMTNAGMPDSHPMHGSFVLAALKTSGTEISHWTGWPKGRWWNSPLLFWDEFSEHGHLRRETGERDAVGALCLGQRVAPGKQAHCTFLLAWHFSNRTPRRCGWISPPGDEDVRIGNWYTTRFADAWEAAEYAATNLPRLESQTRTFAAALRNSSLPGAVKDAVTANLSTLATTTCFRTADGEFHGFEGSDDKKGCCHGNCTHVWNYETVTPYLFPKFARSLREAAFGYSLDDAGAMHFRQALPDGKVRSGFAAADGQMGQIVHAYLDWKLSGDQDWLRSLWPRIKKGLEFAWIRGGWDADRDGVMEGVQHNTYDVEFYGPNPQCGVYYLAALRAGEEMARAVGDTASANEYRNLFGKGSRWIDAHLFNGEYYVQQVVGRKTTDIASGLRSDMGSEDTEDPQYQVGKGCLVDQLIGQYMADVSGLGSLLGDRNIRAALASIHRYNYKPDLFTHDSVQRTFALNDEAALIVCDYGRSKRPRIPFPYYAELFTGMEYSTAAQMLYRDLIPEGLQCIESVRARYDGERRNPYDEAECGHHYARAMSAWSSLLALSGFHYDGSRQSLRLFPKMPSNIFRCFWSTAKGWGTFERRQSGSGSAHLLIKVESGELQLQSCEWQGPRGNMEARLDGQALAHNAEWNAVRSSVFRFASPLSVTANQSLTLKIGA